MTSPQSHTPASAEPKYDPVEAAGGHPFSSTEAVPGYCVKCGSSSDVHVQAAVTELAEVIWHASRADESTISATGANVVAAAVIAAGWSKR